MNILLCGGAGFIGSHLADRLLAAGHYVVIVDNLSRGRRDNIKHLFKSNQVTFIESDLSNFGDTCRIFKDNCFEVVFHLAANSDIKLSSTNPVVEFNNTFLTTYNILECMRLFNVKRLLFSSTSAVYGEKTDINIYEDIGPLFPISYYGGAKLASEGFISAYTFMNNFKTVIFRFPNVIGSRLTHGVIFDFIKKLKNNNKRLEILGDGTQTKPYLHVSDLLNAIMLLMNREDKGINCFNIGVESETSVADIADMVCKKMDLKQVKYYYTGGKTGWKGDVASFKYDLSKIHSLGWKAKYSSNEAVLKTLEEVLNIESSNNGGR